MRRLGAALAAVAAGGIFGLGLMLGGMTQPAKVIAFLDFFGDWDPSLAFVMGGAILAYLPLHRIIVRGAPLFAFRHQVPQRHEIDAKLLIGATLFGVGWGIAGYCPGPALTSIGAASPSAGVFVPAMIVGMLLDGWLQKTLNRPSKQE